MAKSNQLSNREWEVVKLLLEGKSNKQIASSLSISDRTVEFHLKNIYEKFQVSSRIELVLKQAVELQIKVPVFFQGVLIGEYYPDVIVNRLVIVEVKAVSSLAVEHEAQLLNYLKTTPIEVVLLVNFGPKLAIKRKVFDNSLKGNFDWASWKPSG